MEVRSFKNIWRKIKPETKKDAVIKLFYLIHGGEPHRRLFCSMREYNPRFLGHWAPLGNCHRNALFMLLLLECKYPERFKIITNDEHSAIYDLKYNCIYDPTYEAANIKFESTIKYFKKGFKLVDFEEHLKDLSE